MFKSVVVTLAATTLLFAQSSSTIQFYDSLGVTKTARFGWQGAPTTGKFFIETPSDNAQNVTVDKGELTAKKVSGDGSGLTNVVPKDGSVTGEKIGVGAVDSTKINTNAVTTIKIKDGAVTNAKVADVDWAKITNKPSIPSEVIANGSVDSSKLAVGAVTPNKIKNNAIDSTKINSDAVTTSKIKDGAVTDAKVAGVDWAKITNKPSLMISGTTFPTISAGTITTTGNVGVGTTTPTNPNTKLTTYSAEGSGTHYILMDGDGTADATLGLQFKQKNLTGAQVGSYRGNLTFDVGTWGSLTNAVTIDATGNVGIGTTIPGDKLEIINGPRDQWLRLGISDRHGNVSSNYGLRFQTGGYMNDINHGYISFETIGTGIAYGAVPIERMRIDRNGNVGIGTTTPGSKLMIACPQDSISDYGIVRIGSFDYSAQINNVVLSIAPGVVNVDAPGVSGGRFKINANGNVGIGEANPTAAKLVVAGNINANGWSSSSDRRFKLSITPLDSSLSKITRLQGVYYLWDTKKFPERNFDTTKQIGLIAQDVEKIIPEVVHTAKDGYKSLSYDKLAAVLIEAVKEQQKIITTQNERIASLESKIAKIDGIEQQLKKLEQKK